MKVRHAEPGKPVWMANYRTHKLVCCSCGRIHFMQFGGGGMGTWITLWDDDEGTRKEREKVIGRKHGRANRSTK